MGCALKSLGSPSGYPNGMVNREIYTGTKLSMGRGSWAAASDVILNDVNSPVNIGLKSSWNSSSRELTVDAELYYTADATGPHLLNIAFLESGVIGNQSGGGATYEHNHILRDFLSGQWGTEVTTTSKESNFKKTYKYTVSGDYNIENCNIAAFVTQADHKKIFTGVEIKAKDGSTE